MSRHKTESSQLKGIRVWQKLLTNLVIELKVKKNKIALIMGFVFLVIVQGLRQE